MKQIKYFFIKLQIITNVITAVCYNSQPCVMQDKFLNENYFFNKRDGIFIEIGAHDGITHSNTYFFEKTLGWSGICIEPMPNIFEALKKNRSCVCLNCCIYNQEKSVPFIFVEGEANMLSGILNTYHAKHLLRLKTEIIKNGGSYKVIDVPAYTLNTILNQYNFKKIDYLSLDTEGSELEILQSIDFDQFHIYCISVENNYDDSRIRFFLESKGFKFIKFLWDQDEIYIKNDLTIDKIL